MHGHNNLSSLWAHLPHTGDPFIFLLAGVEQHALEADWPSLARWGREFRKLLSAVKLG